MAVFATKEKLTFIDINRAKGNILQLIDKANGYIKEHIIWKPDLSGMKCKEIPLNAIREIVCNSFAHARYNAMTEHEIDIHPDKVSVYNPGEFPIGYKPEDFIESNQSSIVRNPLILDTLYMSDDIESYGSGLKRVYEECRQNGIEIKYSMKRDGLEFIFLRRNVVNNDANNVVNNLSAEEKSVLELISQNRDISAAQISQVINKSPRTVQRILQSLKVKNVIVRTNGTRVY